MTPTVAGLGLPTLDPTHKLHRVLASALGSKPAARAVLASPPWDAAFFGLNQSTLFQTATTDEQTRILQQASQDLLVEAYCLEKAGMGYMAKMTLLAETTEERMTYALFSADECTHLAQLSAFLTEAETQRGADDAFLQLLMPLLETSDRSLLLFVIQVVLEGWGLSHYRTLSQGCRQPALAELFRSFLQAEARHHGAGVTLFDPTRLSTASHTAIIDVLADFLQMVRRGPQRVVHAIAQVKGGLTPTQRLHLLTELETEIHSATRLATLRSLIAPIAPSIAETLDRHELFSPLSPMDCV